MWFFSAPPDISWYSMLNCAMNVSSHFLYIHCQHYHHLHSTLYDASHHHYRRIE